MASEEEWNVVQKVLVGDGKYREYRLTRALDTDRAPLWGAGHDVITDINDIVAGQSSELLELKRRIKRLEISQSNWIQIGKSVNKSNEKFFLNVVKSSKDDMKRFEQENFFSNRSWTKLRDMSELPEDQLEELLDKEGDDVVSAMRIFTNKSSKKKENKTGHYYWVSKRLAGLTTSQVNGVGEQSCVVKTEDNQQSVSNGFKVSRTSDVTKDNDPLPNRALPVESLEAATESVTNTRSEPTNESIDQDLKDTPTTQVTVSTEQSGKMYECSIGIGEKLDDEKITVENKECRDNREERPTETAECHFDNTDESTAVGEGKEENQSSPNICTCTELNDDSCRIPSPAESQSPVVECFLRRDDIQKSANVEKTEQVNSHVQVQSTHQVNKRFVDPSGYTRLRLSSTSSSTNSIPITPEAAPLVTGNIWEQKAQKRKDAEEQRKLEQQRKLMETACVSKEVPQCSTKSQQSHASTPQKTNSSVPPYIVKNSWKSKNQKKENQKPANNNDSWITISSKMSTRPANESILETAKEDILTVSQKPVEQLLGSTVSVGGAVKPMFGKENGHCSKNGESKQAKTEDESDEKTVDKISKTEKRSKYRQRLHEKIKSKAKEEAERRKIEHDLKIEEEKKEKAMKFKLEFEKNQKEMERLRQEREEKHNRHSESDKKARHLLETKERLDDHLEKRVLAYQIVGSKLYIDKRLPELKNNQGTDINSIKYKILNTFKQRQVELEKRSMLLTFASYHLKENNKLKIRDILEYMTSSCLHGEPTNAIQKEIHKDSNDFFRDRKFNSADAMIQALVFAESVIKRTRAMTDRNDDVEYVEKILTDYKNQQNDVVEFIGITSYLRTRIEMDLFIVEEDFLVMSVDMGSSGYLEEADAESDDDEEEYEKPEVQDMSCQTDGEPYDVRAASYMARVEENERF